MIKKIHLKNILFNGIQIKRTHLNIESFVCDFIFKYIYCENKGSGNSGPFHIKRKAHAEEEEMLEDE